MTSCRRARLERKSARFFSTPRAASRTTGQPPLFGTSAPVAASRGIPQHEAQEGCQRRELADPEEEIPLHDVEPQFRQLPHHLEPELRDFIGKPAVEAIRYFGDP